MVQTSLPLGCRSFYKPYISNPSKLFNVSMNRRTTSNVLELVEESLDYNLLGSQIRFHFHDTQIIGGISIHESHGNVIVLVVTAISVHRLVFPHPSKLIKNVSKNLHKTWHSFGVCASAFP